MPAPIIPILLGAGIVALVALGGKHAAASAPVAPTPAKPVTPAPGVPGIVPPAGTPAIPPEWGLPGGVVAPPTPGPGGVPFPGSTTGPSTALPDNGIAGLPEPLKSTTVIAMTNAKTVEDANALDGLALELDRMGQHKAAIEVRTRSNQVRSASGTTVVGAPIMMARAFSAPTAAPRADILAPYTSHAPAVPYTPTRMDAYSWGVARGREDALSNKPFWPGGAVLHSDIARDGAKLGWPGDYTKKVLLDVKMGYEAGYRTASSSTLSPKTAGMVGAPIAMTHSLSAPAVHPSYATPAYSTTAQDSVYAWGLNHGTLDCKSNRPFAPDGALPALTELAKRFGWSPTYLGRMREFMHAGYASGYNTCAKGSY